MKAIILLLAMTSAAMAGPRDPRCDWELQVDSKFMDAHSGMAIPAGLKDWQCNIVRMQRPEQSWAYIDCQGPNSIAVYNEVACAESLSGNTAKDSILFTLSDGGPHGRIVSIGLTCDCVFRR